MDDLISRQALYEKACDYERQALDHIQKINPDKHEELVAWSAVLAERTSFKMDVMDAPSAQRWIPCSERLPEKDGKYLITGRQGAVNILKFEDGRWYGKWGVLAWRPLPEPYREEVSD